VNLGGAPLGLAAMVRLGPALAQRQLRRLDERGVRGPILALGGVFGDRVGKQLQHAADH
jgi:hypothetical protein